MSDEFRTCTRTGCRWPAAASLSYRYDTREVWVLDLAHQPHPSLYDLCPHHADALTVMRGWKRIDERVAIPAVVEPAAPERLRALAPARVAVTTGGGAPGGGALQGAPPAPVARTPAPPLDRPVVGSQPATPLRPGMGSHPAGMGSHPAGMGSHPAGTTRRRADRPSGDRYAGLHSELPRLAAEYEAQLPPTALRPTPVRAQAHQPEAAPALPPAVPIPPPASGERDDADAAPPPPREVEGQLAIPVAELAGGAVVVSISTRRRPAEPRSGSKGGEADPEPPTPDHDLNP